MSCEWHKNDTSSHTPWYIVCIVATLGILGETGFDEFIMRRRPAIGFILGAVTIIAITVIACSSSLQQHFNIHDTLTTFLIIKAYLLCLPTTALSLFRCIHGRQSQFIAFKNLFCGLSSIQHKMGNPHVIAVTIYLFLVSNITEAVFFEFMMFAGYDWRDDVELRCNPVLNDWHVRGSCLLNAVVGVLVILMIPLPRNNWYLFSELTEKEQTTQKTEERRHSLDVSYEISIDRNRRSVIQQMVKDAELNDAEWTSIKYEDLAMYLPKRSGVSVGAGYLWILVYSSWNYLFTVRFFAGSNISMGPVHLLPCIIRAVYHRRSDLWLQSRLHVLWSCLFIYLPITKALGVSTSYVPLNQKYMIAWSVLNFLAAVVCTAMFMVVKNNGGQPSPLKVQCRSRVNTESLESSASPSPDSADKQHRVSI